MGVEGLGGCRSRLRCSNSNELSLPVFSSMRTVEGRQHGGKCLSFVATSTAVFPIFNRINSSTSSKSSVAEDTE